MAKAESVLRVAGEAARGAWGARGQACAGRMRAWRAHAYGPAAEVRVEEARVPPLRGPRQLLVRVAAASVNPIDVAMVGGYGARMLNVLRGLRGGADGPEFPLVPGRDFAGVVELAGVAAPLRRGDRVWGVVPPHCQGALAEYVVVEGAWAGAAPAGMPVEEAGGALYAALTACAALRAAGLPADAGGGGGGRRPRALLLGLGGVGHAALQLLVRRGVEVVVGCSADVCARALALGAAAALDRRAPDYDAHLCEGGPYEAIVDCAGIGGWGASARRWQYSRYVTLTTPLLREGDARGPALGAAAAAAHLAAQCAAAAAGAMGATGATGAEGTKGATGAICAPAHVRWAFFAPNAGDVELLRRLAERGEFRVAVERVFPWWECAEALRRAGAGAARGKLVVDWASAAPPLTNDNH